MEAELIEDEGEPRYKLTDIIGNNYIFLFITIPIQKNIRTILINIIMFKNRERFWLWC